MDQNNLGTSGPVPRAATRRSGRRPTARPRTVALRRTDLSSGHHAAVKPAGGSRIAFLAVGFLLALLLLGGLAAIWWPTNIELADGRKALFQAQGKYIDALKAVKARNLTVAIENLRLADSFFSQIGGHEDLKQAKKELSDELTRLRNEDLKVVERDLKVEIEYQRLLHRLAQLSDGKGEDSDSYIRLKRDMEAFRANPVDPTSGASPDNAGIYQPLVDEIARRIWMVDRAIQDEINGKVTNPVKQLQANVEAKVREERFGEAIEMIDLIAAKYPQSDPVAMASVRQYLDAAIVTTWSEVRNYVETRYGDYESPGLNADFRIQRLREAQTRLDKIIRTWGLRDKVEAAKTYRARYP